MHVYAFYSHYWIIMASYYKATIHKYIHLSTLTITCTVNQSILHRHVDTWSIHFCDIGINISNQYIIFTISHLRSIGNPRNKNCVGYFYSGESGDVTVWIHMPAIRISVTRPYAYRLVFDSGCSWETWNTDCFVIFQMLYKLAKYKEILFW